MRTAHHVLVGLAAVLVATSCKGRSLEASAAAAAAPLRPNGDDFNRSIHVLRSALVSSDYATRLLAVEALGRVHAFDAGLALERALGDPEHDVRAAAIESLRQLGSPRAWEALRTVRDDNREALD